MLLVSVEEGTNQESTQEQIFENIRLHKEVIQSVKLQPWHIRKKLKLVRQVSDGKKRRGREKEGAFTWHALAPLNSISYVNFATLSRPRFGALFTLLMMLTGQNVCGTPRGGAAGAVCHVTQHAGFVGEV